MEHVNILAVLRPSGPDIDPVVDLTKRLVAGQPTPEYALETARAARSTWQTPSEDAVEGEIAYWIRPVKGDADQRQECIRSPVGEEGVYAFGDRTPGQEAYQAWRLSQRLCHGQRRSSARKSGDKAGQPAASQGR